MKFVHIADMHFDTPFTLLSEKENFGDIRRLEQREAFKKIIEYIKEEKIPYLFISGDLYDHAYIKETTINYINNLFKEIPETKVFISPGNHDPFLKNSYYNNFNWNDNVYIFNNEIGLYEFDDVDIYGYGFNDFYCSNFNVNNIKIKNKEKINVLVVHGDVNASKTGEMQYNPVASSELENLGFDYIAMGHIHKRQIINKNIVYPGSAISLGFDEPGEHGMLQVELDKNNLNINFIRIDNREFKESEIDISNINTFEELIEKINNLVLEDNIVYKMVLVGERNFEIDINKLVKLINKNNILKIKNNTKIKYNLEEISKQNNLKGIFVKEMLELLQENPEKKEIIENAIEIGLNNMQ